MLEEAAGAGPPGRSAVAAGSSRGGREAVRSDPGYAADAPDESDWTEPGSGGSDWGAEDLVDGADEPRARARRAARGSGGGGRHTRDDGRERPALVSWPVGLRDRQAAAAYPVVLAFLLLALAAGAVFGLRVMRAQATAQAVPVNASTPAGSPAALTGTAPGGTSTGTVPGPAPGATAGASPTGSGGASGELRVHVVGQVERAGVVRLPAGSRVEDALDAAGGPGPKADLTAVNLARALVDGEQIYVPRPGESPPQAAPAASGAPAGPGGATSAGGSASVNVNTADAAGLDALPGVGPVLAKRIVDWRTTNGRFTSVEQLGEVSGIGEKLLAQLTPLVTL